ncbi:unnamed protein product [Sphenostylis stenocarpa]|uniref:FHA domain-containing protein n=1 Tax=Sphenostylis stenocarpa TaxID=92480 RepID=A0AA86VVL3_9FABA|nr:unnamed protein product [Sphenostylis stenocarpa]
MTNSMGPPPPISPNPPDIVPSMSPPRDSAEPQPPPRPPRDLPKPPSQDVAVPYKIPPWSAAPCHQFYLEVLKDGSIIDKFDVCAKGAYMFGRLDLCDFVLEHPTISRFHAVIQFKRSGDAYIYDIGSTHGTFLNKIQVEKNTYVDLNVGDVIRFGRSSRLFIFQGPSDLMPPETNAKLMNEVKMREAFLDREASVRRARQETSLAEGISWGMGEDAIEEEEDDAEEVTWQSYKGQLTEKQEKTREKIIKRMEKIANMKKEINSIRVKDISQGGLTQGQQVQIARNEQRITQVMLEKTRRTRTLYNILEELENLEETLNDSIRESLGARTGKMSNGKKKGAVEEEEEYFSDDDEFYDRTKKKPSHQKPGENQSVETADTLLDKRDAITNEMNEKKEMLMIEKNNMLSKSESASQVEVGDSLDVYMSGLSSQLGHDKSVQLEKELSTLQSELDRIGYLLKLADPTGEAAKKRELIVQEPKPKKSENTSTIKKPPAKAQKSCEPCAKADNKKVKKPHVETQISETSIKSNDSIEGEKAAAAITALDKSEPGCDKLEAENVVFAVPRPQWLGAVKDRVTDDTQQSMPSLHVHDTDESNQFVDYKDRSKILGSGDSAQTSMESKIESSAGLILRKRKQVETTATNSNDVGQQLTSSTSGEKMAEDAVALLLKHNRGLFSNEEEEICEGQERRGPKRVLGPEKPSFLNNEMDYDSWVPPEGQSGDGRTSLNDRFGY